MTQYTVEQIKELLSKHQECEVDECSETGKYVEIIQWLLDEMEKPFKLYEAMRDDSGRTICQQEENIKDLEQLLEEERRKVKDLALRFRAARNILVDLGKFVDFKDVQIMPEEDIDQEIESEYVRLKSENKKS